MSLFTRKTWKDRITEYPTRRTLTKADGSAETVTVARSEGTVSQEGDAFSAANMNDLEARIATAFGYTIGPFTISAGSTSYVINSDYITASSLIDVYPSNDTEGIMADAVSHGTQTEGSMTITFDSATSGDIVIEAVRITEK